MLGAHRGVQEPIHRPRTATSIQEPRIVAPWIVRGRHPVTLRGEASDGRTSINRLVAAPDAWLSVLEPSERRDVR